MSRRTPVACLLVVATLAVYARALTFDFISFDDPNYVTENPVVQEGLTTEGLAWALTTGHAENWHPVTWLSHMLDVELFGLDPAGHHGTNVVLHAANTLILFLLLAALTGAVGASGWVAGMFALHPLHVESVAWVAERKDLLSTAFALLAIAAWASYARRPRAAPYVLTLALLALSLAAKPMFVTLPFLLLLLDVWPLGRARTTAAGRLVVEKLPLLVPVVLSAVVTLRVQAVTEADLADLALGPRLANAVAAYGAYLLDTVWPAGLGLFYPHPWMPGGEPLPALSIGLAALALAAISAAVLWLRRPPATVGWCWFLGTLVPVLGLVQVGAQGRADRYTYFPLIGIFIAVAFPLRAALESAGPGPRRAGAVLATAVLVVCAALARVQLGHWRDSETVYTRALAVEPRAAIIESNLALIYQERGDRDLARQHFERALEINPELRLGLGNLGALLRSINEFAAAEPVLRRAVTVYPDFHGARADLAWVLAAQGKLAAAREELRIVLGAAPDHALAHRVLGMTLEAGGEPDRALEAYRRAAELDPSGANHEILAEHLVRRGDAAGALEVYRESRRRGYAPARISTRIGRLLLNAGRPAEAVPEFERALAADPDHAPARRGLAEARRR